MLRYCKHCGEPEITHSKDGMLTCYFDLIEDGLKTVTQFEPDLLHEISSVVLSNLDKVIIECFVSDRECFVNGNFLEAKYSQSIRNHSPDGFSWGYNGSGCAQLALAILLELLPKHIALLIYQDFKSDVISKHEMASDFKITINLIEWLTNNEKIKSLIK